jgi:hypothetical protein
MGLEYIDMEGDFISMETNEDLEVAFDIFKDKKRMKLFVKKKGFKTECNEEEEERKMGMMKKKLFYRLKLIDDYLRRKYGRSLGTVSKTERETGEREREGERERDRRGTETKTKSIWSSSSSSLSSSSSVSSSLSGHERLSLSTPPQQQQQQQPHIRLLMGRRWGKRLGWGGRKGWGWGCGSGRKERLLLRSRSCCLRGSGRLMKDKLSRDGCGRCWEHFLRKMNKFRRFGSVYRDNDDGIFRRLEHKHKHGHCGRFGFGPVVRPELKFGFGHEFKKQGFGDEGMGWRIKHYVHCGDGVDGHGHDGYGYHGWRHHGYGRHGHGHDGHRYHDREHQIYGHYGYGYGHNRFGDYFPRKHGGHNDHHKCHDEINGDGVLGENTSGFSEECGDLEGRRFWRSPFFERGRRRGLICWDNETGTGTETRMGMGTGMQSMNIMMAPSLNYFKRIGMGKRLWRLKRKENQCELTREDGDDDNNNDDNNDHDKDVNN